MRRSKESGGRSRRTREDFVIKLFVFNGGKSDRDGAVLYYGVSECFVDEKVKCGKLCPKSLTRKIFF